MSFISSQMNSRTFQAFGLMSPYHAFRGSMNQVRFVLTRKIELGRSSEVHTLLLRNPAQVA